MNLKEALQQGQKLLKEALIGSYLIDAELLLLETCKVNKTTLYCNPELELSKQQYHDFLALIKLRQKHKPVSKIIGYKEFYSLNFRTNQHTLDPRPDTETLIDACKTLLNPKKQYSFLEIGTGTGCIIITLLKIFNVSRGTSRDISQEALKIAALNSQDHHLEDRLILEENSMFDDLKLKYDLIISNPPYIKKAQLDLLAPEVKNFDPHLALYGGIDGLDYYKIIAMEAKTHLTLKGVILLEIGYDQANEVKELFKQEAYSLIEQYKDLAGHIRCLAFSAKT